MLNDVTNFWSIFIFYLFNIFLEVRIFLISLECSFKCALYLNAFRLHIIENKNSKAIFALADEYLKQNFK